MPKSDPREALSTDAWQMIVFVAGNWKRDQNDTALIKAIASEGDIWGITRDEAIGRQTPK